LVGFGAPDRSIGAFELRVVVKELSMDFLSEFWRFIRVRKKYWLVPMLLTMVVFGGLVVLAKGSAVAPFIYTLF